MTELSTAPTPADLGPEELNFIEDRLRQREVRSLQTNELPVDREEYIRDFSNWLTGNFDPATGMHTFYRFVRDEAALESIRNNGGVTSRVVDKFGEGSDIVAFDRLRALTEGKADPEIRGIFASFMPLMVKDQGGDFKDVDALIKEGTVSDRIRIYAAGAMRNIGATSNEEELFAASVRESNGASPQRGSLDELFYSPLHFTTKSNLYDAKSLLRSDQYRITLEIYPGQLAPTGRLVSGEFQGVLNEPEWEWTGFGAIYPVQHEQIKVERTAELESP